MIGRMYSCSWSALLQMTKKHDTEIHRKFLLYVSHSVTGVWWILKKEGGSTFVWLLNASQKSTHALFWHIQRTFYKGHCWDHLMVTVDTSFQMFLQNLTSSLLSKISAQHCPNKGNFLSISGTISPHDSPRQWPCTVGCQLWSFSEMSCQLRVKQISAIILIRFFVFNQTVN